MSPPLVWGNFLCLQFESERGVFYLATIFVVRADFQKLLFSDVCIRFRVCVCAHAHTHALSLTHTHAHTHTRYACVIKQQVSTLRLDEEHLCFYLYVFQHLFIYISIYYSSIDLHTFVPMQEGFNFASFIYPFNCPPISQQNLPRRQNKSRE